LEKAKTEPIDEKIGATVKREPIDENIGACVMMDPMEEDKMGAIIKQEPIDDMGLLIVKIEEGMAVIVKIEDM
jgi:hypothetical protein